MLLQSWEPVRARPPLTLLQVAALLLLHLPTITLALVGLTRALKQPKGRLCSALNALMLPLVPLCLLELLDCIFTNSNILDFLGKSDKKKYLGLDFHRTFFGSVLQFMLQVQ